MGTQLAKATKGDDDDDHGGDDHGPLRQSLRSQKNRAALETYTLRGSVMTGVENSPFYSILYID